MNLRFSILGAAALLGLAAGAGHAQDAADPIGGLLEQAQEAPNPEDPEAESVPTAPGEAPPPAVTVVAPAQTPPAPFAPQTPASPPPSVSYPLPPVNHAPPPPAPYAAPAPYVAPSDPPPSPAQTYAPPPAPTPAAPYVAPYAPPPRPRLTEPVHIDELGKTPDAPPSAVDRNYENRLRASSASAQGLQGPLDGAWTLRGTSGSDLYTFLLVDNGVALEGAWRDPRRRGAVDSSGFLNDIQRTGVGLSLSFYAAPGAGLTLLTLSPAANGTWTGDLEERGDRRRVILRRD